MRPFRVLPVLALVAASATCHLDRLVKSSGGGGGGGGPPPPGPPVTLAFTVQPRGTKPDSAIKPPVQVTARDSAGNTSTNYNGVIRVAIATDGSAGKNAKLVGDTVATAVSGVATFSGLSVDQPGSGYTLSAGLATGPSMGTSAAFDVSTVPPPPPTTGDLTVSAVTTGSDLDPDGYTVTVDGAQSQALGVNASVTYSGLTAADHSVQIGGIASNCTVSGANPQTASVPAGATAQVTFDITCAALPPTTGDLKVTTSTTGSNLDPDGYTVSVDGGAGQPITINNSTGVTFTALTPGSHSVALSGVAANCAVSGGATQTVNITANQTATLAFAVTCAATTGSISITTNTGGSNLDPDGYTVAVDGGTGQAIGINAAITLTSIPTGSRTVTLSGVASNCTVSGGNSQTTTVTSGQTATVTFSVTCAATTGSLTVTTTTSGSNLDPDGYTVAVDGGTGQAIGINTSFTFNGVATGSHTVTLSGVAGNCTVSGGNSQTTTVASGQSATVTFSVTCAALTGSLTVTTATSGSNQPSGYTVTVDGGQSKNIAASGNVSYTGLAATSHSVQLNGVPSNCSVSEANPQSVSVPANGTGQASFTVTCAAVTGSLTVTTATSGSNQPSGYTVTVDGGQSRSIGASSSVTYTGLTATTHSVQLTGVPSNCSVSESNPQSVTVPANGTGQASFTISCAALTGSLTVTTATSGSNQPSGYTVTVDGGQSRSIGASGSVTYTGLTATSHSVQLTGVPSNCSVSESNPQSVTVPANGTGQASFTITCTAPTGSLTVTTATSGSNQPSGYTVTVDGGQSRSIGINGSVTYTGLSAASHSVQLNGVPSNCTVSEANPQSVTVPSNGTGQASFTISCAALTGSLTVTTATSGSNLPSGYTVTVDGGQSRSIGINGSTTYTGLTATSHSVQLTGVPSNCSVSESNPQSVTVPANGTGQASFTITCTAPTGSLTVTTATSGSNLPSGYTVTVDGGQSRSIGINGSVTYTGLTATSHSVQLTGVPSNCSVSESNPQSVTVPANGSGQASFTVTCSAPPNQPPAVIAGGNQNVLVGALFTLSGASFSDPNHNGPWTITIDWGDGSSDVNTTSNEGSIAGSHSYITVLRATYTVTITVTDAGGLSGSASKTVSVTTL